MNAAHVFKFLEWVLYLALFLNSIIFSWGVLEKFNSQDHGIKQRKEPIEDHPTIILCTYNSTYITDFNITYITYAPGTADSVLLKIGVNHLETGEKIYLKEVFAGFDKGICYNITAMRIINQNLTMLSISSNSGQKPILNVYFTSVRNSYGIITSPNIESSSELSLVS